MVFQSIGHTELFMLANGYMELYCCNPWMPYLQRIWLIRRIVDYARIDI